MAETNLITLNFYGNKIETFKEGGKEWVSIRSLCAGMGLHVEAQREKLLRKKEKFSCSVKRVTAHDGKQYESHCIPVDKVPGWLFTIDADRVRADAKEAVLLYQEECFRVLYGYWHGKGQDNKQLAPLNPQPRVPMQHKLISIDPNTGKTEIHDYSGKIIILQHEKSLEAINETIERGEKLRHHGIHMLDAFSKMLLGGDIIPDPDAKKSAA